MISLKIDYFSLFHLVSPPVILVKVKRIDGMCNIGYLDTYCGVSLILKARVENFSKNLIDRSYTRIKNNTR